VVTKVPPRTSRGSVIQVGEPDVLAVVLHELRLARAEGASFPAAWAPATRTALAASTRFDRAAWVIAFRHTRADWQASYLGYPPRPVPRQRMKRPPRPQRTR
jgi:hypothetical protein